MAALRGWDALDDALVEVEPLLEGYLRARERTFGADVRHKRARLMEVSAFLDELPEGRGAERQRDASRRGPAARSVVGGRSVSGSLRHGEGEGSCAGAGGGGRGQGP